MDVIKKWKQQRIHLEPNSEEGPGHLKSMNFLDRFKKGFLPTSLLLFALLALITQRQVLVGKVPLPAELLGYFSA